ncbi:MAG: type II toxin-antitoxin system Phd/YefM family antitoxin [Verrucomicrobiota bacterium]
MSLIDTRAYGVDHAVMTVTSTKLRENVYALLDEVLATGNPLEVERKGRKLLIIPQKPVSKLERLSARSTIKGDPEDLVHLDWSKEWKP